MKKILVVAGDLNPGPLALATSALITELRQPSTFKTSHFSFMKVLEVEGCRSSVVRALVAKASGPGFKSPATTKIFFTFFLGFFPDPL